MTKITRRRLLESATAVAATGGFVTRAVRAPAKGLAQPKAGATSDGVKALVYDVFGTCVDWRTGVARDAERILKPLGYKIDWLAFADAWRALYQPSMEAVRSGHQPYAKLDILHRRMLDKIRPKFGLEKLDNKVADDLNLAWHRLDAWPDTVPGFVRLKRKFIWRRARTATSRSWSISPGATISRGMQSWAPRSPTTSSRSPPSI